MQQRQHREPYRRTRVTSQPEQTAHDRAGSVHVHRSEDPRPEPVPTDRDVTAGDRGVQPDQVSRLVPRRRPVHHTGRGPPFILRMIDIMTQLTAARNRVRAPWMATTRPRTLRGGRKAQGRRSVSQDGQFGDFRVGEPDVYRGDVPAQTDRLLIPAIGGCVGGRCSRNQLVWLSQQSTVNLSCARAWLA